MKKQYYTIFDTDDFTQLGVISVDENTMQHELIERIENACELHYDEDEVIIDPTLFKEGFKYIDKNPSIAFHAVLTNQDCITELRLAKTRLIGEK